MEGGGRVLYAAVRGTVLTPGMRRGDSEITSCLCFYSEMMRVKPDLQVSSSGVRGCDAVIRGRSVGNGDLRRGIAESHVLAGGPPRVQARDGAADVPWDVRHVRDIMSRATRSD